MSKLTKILAATVLTIILIVGASSLSAKTFVYLGYGKSNPVLTINPPKIYVGQTMANAIACTDKYNIYNNKHNLLARIEGKKVYKKNTNRVILIISSPLVYKTTNDVYILRDKVLYRGMGTTDPFCNFQGDTISQSQMVATILLLTNEIRE